tara:strand:+ start:708 stop:911 length:204 start_codon:yes stop_codon:yes gene_type:complete
MYKLSPIKEESFSELNSENSSFTEYETNRNNKNVFMLFISFIVEIPNKALQFLTDCMKIEEREIFYY